MRRVRAVTAPGPERGDVLAARDITVSGRVQGVGFRPFVFRMAVRFGVSGWVRNRVGLVEIHAEGTAAALLAFEAALTAEAPPLARPSLRCSRPARPSGQSGFELRQSAEAEAPEVHLPPDLFCCPDCQAEMAGRAERRHRYPFTNCTQCGPRYSIIAALPYDRARTAMADFALCADCRAEFEDPGDRRFHAQPLACPACGPALRFRGGGEHVAGTEAALSATLSVLRGGGIIAVRSVGGYHLLCDASREEAVRRLRERKRRPDKPFAVMFPETGPDGCAALRAQVHLDPAEVAACRDPARPIVLVRRRPEAAICAAVAPGLDTLGVLLPYAPLHHLLLSDFGGPLVATSGNLSGEPVLTGIDEAETRLGSVADAFLHHDRPILRPVEDGVVRVIGGVARPFRIGRGVAPLEIDLAHALDEPVIATGGHMKNAPALGWGQRAVVAPHVGDLDTPRAQAVFERVGIDLASIYRTRPARILCDANPAYAGTRWARTKGLPTSPVGHHVAHASALAGEHPGERDWLTFVWDGVGLGPGGELWGGEAFLGGPGRWRRVASLRPFRLLAPDRAAREPWRSAAALAWETGRAYPAPELAEQAWRKGVGTFRTSSAGRLFDAAAALVLGLGATSYEGQGPMMLERCAGAGGADAAALPLLEDGDGILRADWEPLLPMLTDHGLLETVRAAAFHESLARAIAAQAVEVGRRHPVACVGLTGGVFQNRLLSERSADLLSEAGFAVFQHRLVPANDGGLAFGQIVEHLHRGYTAGDG